MFASTDRPKSAGLRARARWVVFPAATMLLAVFLLLLAAAAAPGEARAGELRAQASGAGEVCAVLYLSGDFVVQPGPEPDPEMGTVIKVFRGLGDTSYSQKSPPPWRRYGTWLERVRFEGGAAPSSLDHWFDNAAGGEGLTDYPFTEVDLSGLDASRLKSMWCAFSYSHLKRIDLSGMSFPALQGFDYVFYGSDLELFKADGLVTPKLEYSFGTFEHCQSLKKVSVRGWRAPALRNTRFMFHECYRLKVADLTGMKAPAIELCSHMFAYCYSLEKVRGVRDLKMRKLRSFSYMYKDCAKLKRVDLSRWAPAALVRATAPFGYCEGLRHVIVGAGFRKLPKGMFAGIEGGAIVTLRTKRLTAKSVRNCMLLATEWVNLVGGGQDIQDQYMPPKLAKIRVQLGSREANKRWAAKYRKIFTPKNTGGYKVRVVAARAPGASAA